jgi:uncharacterized protein (UPF0210 family)
MQIRSITLFAEPAHDRSRASAFYDEARKAFHVPVQTTRLATPPFPDWWDPELDTASQAAAFQESWTAAGAEYIGLGPVQLSHEERWLECIPDLIGATEVLFATAEVSSAPGQIDTGRCHLAAELIRANSTLLQNGFANLRFAALANCSPGIPFFPAAYHGGGPAHFAVAVESADLAVSAVSGAASLEEARNNLVRAIEEETRAISAVAERLAAAHQLTYSGIDFSLVPFPTDDRSLGTALEALGLAWLGAPGSLFAAAFMAEAIGRARFPRCGFSGVFLPILEDSVVALRAGESRLTVTDALNYSAVCGLGLDTLPLPGNVSAEELAGIILDVAALSLRLNKPLTARLMPIPGKSAGEAFDMNFAYFAPGRVMESGGAGVSGLLRRPSRLELRSIHDR